MSVKVLAYLSCLSKEFLPGISSRFRDLGMDFQLHPDFELNSSGTVQARLGTELSSIEFSFKDFRYTAPVSVNPAINHKLKQCTKVVTIRMHATHTNAFRVGLYFAAFLAEVANGIVYIPQSDDYVEPQQAIVQFGDQIKTYESELSLQDWRVVPFREFE